jgi:predicted ATPase/class 3 adenylate cyclase
MNSLSTYLPQDRLRALSRGETLPNRTRGTALFADISGFTPLTEKLTNELGPRRGVEELSSRLNQVYDALIGALEQYGGSVIGFAGDAITCWFDEQIQNSEVRSLNSAIAMQTAMQAFPDLALKIAVASGPARRFVVGDPDIQLLDTLAGTTLVRMAAGEHLAQKGEILTDEASLGEGFTVQEWRTDPESGEKFGVIGNWRLENSPSQQLPATNHQSQIANLQSEILRPWLLPAVYQREQAGMGAFLTELRSVVALFLRFDGIDYDADESAGEKLNTFIRRAQEIVTRNGGTLLDVTIGDKGNYSYSAFGAPVAHENDSRRALNAALELRAMAAELPFITGVQIGISRGAMRTGAYGGSTRRTYGVLGDEVNLASRLMLAAQAGQIVVAGRVQYAAIGDFSFEAIPAIRVKGKSQPVTVFLLNDVARHKNYRLLDPTYALPMVGRQAELTLIAEKMDFAAQGHGQIVAITAEAGMGKSRLVAEAIHLAQRRGFTGYGGACQSDGLNAAYLVWRAILRGFFDMDIDAPAEKQAKWLGTALESFAPNRLPALPLIAGAMGLSLPDNDFTRGLEPKDRKSALESALVDCLRCAAEAAKMSKSALLFVLEDLHWMDALSHDLLEEIARASENLPILLLLAYRPPEIERISAPRLEKLPYFTRIKLISLTLNETTAAINAKLAQLFPEQPGSLPETLTQKLMERSQGNPFYLEELLNYLRDRGIDPRDETALGRIDLPDSLHTLVLSRLDQLGEYEKTTLKVASIIGRLFRAGWLNGYYPELGADELLKPTLEQLRWLEITPLDTPEPELAYLFKHLVTHEVTYESLPFATRALLHEQLARWLESALPEPLPLDLLAYHYGKSNNTLKKRDYWQKAGDVAKESYANETALEYYDQVLPLVEEPGARADVYLKQAIIYQLIGKWPEAETAYKNCLAESKKSDNRSMIVQSQRFLGRLCDLRGRPSEAMEWFQAAFTSAEALGDTASIAKIFIQTGGVYERTGNYDLAREQLHRGLGISREQGYEDITASALNTIGVLEKNQGNYPLSKQYLEESLERYRKVNNIRSLSAVLNNMGVLLWNMGEFAQARTIHEESLAIKNQIGDKWGAAASLNNLGNVCLQQDDLDAAQRYYEDSLKIKLEIGDQRGIPLSYGNLANLALMKSEYAQARIYFIETLKLSQKAVNKQSIVYTLMGMSTALQGLSQTYRAACLLSAAENARKGINLAWEMGGRDGYVETLEKIQRAIPEDEFNRAWADGEIMSLEEAILFAMESR